MCWDIIQAEPERRQKHVRMIKVRDPQGQEQKEIIVFEKDYYSLGLYDKESLTAEEVEDLLNRYEFQKGKSYALNLLASKPYSILEIYRKLTARGHNVMIADGICEYLKEMSYLDDEEYARKYVSTRMKVKPISRKMLLLELKQKGIENDTAEDILQRLAFSEGDMAAVLYRKKFKHLDPDDSKEQRKVIQFFIGKGFEPSIIRKILDQEQNSY